jgi:hypothetical protein
LIIPAIFIDHCPAPKFALKGPSIKFYASTIVCEIPVAKPVNVHTKPVVAIEIVVGNLIVIFEPMYKGLLVVNVTKYSPFSLILLLVGIVTDDAGSVPGFATIPICPK